MKSIYAELIENNIPYSIVKYRSKWYIAEQDGTQMYGDGFPTKGAAAAFMAEVRASVISSKED